MASQVVRRGVEQGLASNHRHPAYAKGDLALGPVPGEGPKKPGASRDASLAGAADRPYRRSVTPDARLAFASAAIVLLGCGAPEERNAPPLPDAGGGNAPAAGDPATPDAGVEDPDEAIPAHCRIDEESGDEGTSTGGSTGESFKFDVGAPDEGPTFEFGCDEASSYGTNLGCEFWALDLPNDDQGTFDSPPASDQQFSVAVGNPSGVVAAHVEVYLPGEDRPFVSAQVDPSRSHAFALPSASIEPNFGTSDGQGYRIVSDTPIVAYQFNPLDNTTEVYSNDASLLLPTHALGDDYVAVTGGAILLAQGAADLDPRNAGAFVSVLATQDDTEVQIRPTAQLAGDDARAKRLRAGQVWTVISTGRLGESGNLSGTTIRSNAPVAVFSGNVATVEPFDAAQCCADHLEHQLSPRTAWGSRYAVAPPPSVSGVGNDPAVYRVTGAFDDTHLLYCPRKPEDAPTHLDAGQTVEFESDAPFTVVAEDPEHAFGVAQFLLSTALVSEHGIGDPAMLIVPSAQQHQTRLTFIVPAGYLETHVTVVARDEDAVMLDGEEVPPGRFRPLGNLGGRTFRYAQVPVAGGQHVIESVGQLGVSVFGYDEAVSFAYPAGAGLRVVSIPPAAG